MKPLTVEELTQKIDGRLCAGQGAAQREVRSGCVCDLLSWVMAHAKKGTAWVTVQTHMNVVAVAELLEIACVIFPDGMEADAAVLNKADETGMPVVSSPKNAFDIAGIIHAAGVRGV